MSDARAVRPASLDRADLVAAVEAVRPPLLEALADADRVVLLPDAHYPFHPSTGMVTNPAVVDALLAALTVRRPPADVAVALRAAPPVDTARTAGYLGYDDVADAHGVDLVVLDGEDGDGTGAPGDGTFVVPPALADAAVVPVPSARIGGSVPLYGAHAVVAAAVGADPADADQVRRAVEAVAPAAALGDATYTFTGHPHRARTLLAGDVTAVDEALATLLGVDADAVPGRSDRGANAPDTAGATAVDGGVAPPETADPGTADGPAADGLAADWSTVDGTGTGEVDLAALAAELPGGDLPASNAPHPLVRAGYRLYTRVSGDVYPPQLRGER